MYKQLLLGCLLLSTASVLYANVREYRDVQELSRGQRAEIAEGVTNQLNLPGTVRNDMLDALLSEGEISTETQQAILQLAQEAEGIQEQIDSLKEIDGFADDHEAIQLLQRDKARIEKRIRSILYDDPLKFQTLLAAGIAIILGMIIYRKQVPAFVDAAANYVDPYVMLSKKYQPRDKRALKSVTSAIILFAGIEFALRGRNALVVPRLIEMVKTAAYSLGAVGEEVFKDGGFSDKLEAWVEDLWRSINIDEYISSNRSTVVDAGMVIGLLAVIVYLARLDAPKSSHPSTDS